MAVIAALLLAYDTGIDPNSGLAITLSAAVVVIVGGNSSIYGTLVASMLLAIIQEYTQYFLSAQWKEPITFCILILMLLWRTEGILQFNNRSDEK
jgi:branched-chain amino acid transport system permease protein